MVFTEIGFMLLAWNDGMLEQWNNGQKNRCRSYCPSLASFQYSNTLVPMVWSTVCFGLL